MLNTLQNRRTYKVIGDVTAPEPIEQGAEDKIDALIEAAGNAPFHYASSRDHHEVLTSCVPWRVYKINGKGCRTLMQERLDGGDVTKIPNMLAAAQFLLQVTWLPEPGSIAADPVAKDAAVFEGTLRNLEHIAAASAFTQSLLLAADNAGYKTYWSSGGPLREAEFFNRLRIPQNQLLLGSIFLFAGLQRKSEVKSGALVDKRGKLDDWSRWEDIS